MTNCYKKLNQGKALIWRIIHRDNLKWVLDNGLYCGNSQIKATHWINIGNLELISKRAIHPVPAPPHGTLNDYVPFYFTPFSPMLLNIHTGRGGVTKRENEEIVILVSKLPYIEQLGLPFLFTDSHAYHKWAKFYSSLSDLDKIDWELLQKRDFSKNAEDPSKLERYQAEALIYQHLPVKGLVGIVCYTEEVKKKIDHMVKERDLALKVIARTGWYFE